MKQIIFTSLILVSILIAHGQNYLAGPVGLYGPQYAGVTNIGTGGTIMVSTGGIWTFGGNVISTDKGNANNPTALGRTEVITFDGTGTYNGASITAGAAGFVIDGYAKVSNQINSFLLPIGSATAAYPITVPSAANIIAAYYAGSGTSQNSPVKNYSTATTEYSPYIDIPSGFVAGNYTFSYPAGFSNNSSSSLLTSDNTSSIGTNSNTTYSLLSNVPNFSSTASYTTASLSASTATQIYFATSLTVLPIQLVSFNGIVSDCTAKLIWKSTSEVKGKYYEVEVSADAVHFIVAGRITSRYNLIGGLYNFSYNLNSVTSFFRLKMVDIDGKYIYSNLVTLTNSGACGLGAQIQVYPNPTYNFINISGLAEGKNHLILFDMAGKKMIDFISNTIYQQLDINKLSGGIYMLNIENLNGNVKSFKIEKH